MGKGPRFRKEREALDDVVGHSTSHDAGADKRRIRCPRCRWQPTRSDRWQCACGHIWHTFETGGLCPSCNLQWQDTQCLHCAEWSRHLEWYSESER